MVFHRAGISGYQNSGITTKGFYYSMQWEICFHSLQLFKILAENVGEMVEVTLVKADDGFSVSPCGDSWDFHQRSI